ncbi:hypothetical protein ACTFIW_013119 [Dictyostelium discoideum]
MKNNFFKKTVAQLILITIFILYSNADEDIITTPPGYYDLKRTKRFPHYSNIESNNISQRDEDLYYPDICADAIPNLEGHTSIGIAAFPGFKEMLNKLLITKGSNMTLSNEIMNSDYLDNFAISILCVEGSLYIPERIYNLMLHSLVILPGGSVVCERGIMFYSFEEYKALNPWDTTVFSIDPMGFFPGILALGGSLTLKGNYPLIYKAQVLSKTSLRISPPFSSTPKDTIDGSYKIKIFSDLNPLGLECTLDHMDASKTIVNIMNCPPIGNEKIMKVAFIKNGLIEMNTGVSNRYYSKPTDESIRASIFITGDTKVHIENYFINCEGRTLNEEYNDTKLIFSHNNKSIVTDIIIGSNQRYRNSLYIEFSNSVVIKNSPIFDKDPKRSPIVFFASNVELTSNIISSYSGSSLIAQFGTENIRSKNNHYFLVPYSRSLNTSAKSMDYGNEGGNGLYSISPNIKSENDSFIGQLNIFNFNFLSNRSSVTGFDRDCYAPCFNDSVSVLSSVQHPVDFYLINPKYFKIVNNPIFNSTGFNLLVANSNGNQPNTYYTINGLVAIGPIIANLDNNVLILKDFIATENFKIDGSVKRLDIINSSIELPLTSKDIIKNVSSLSTNIRNSYLYYPSNDSVEQLKDQIYGSVITPYYYNNPITLDQIKIVSIYPNSPLQVISGLAFNIEIQFRLIYAIQDFILCIFTSDNDSIQNRTVDFNVLTNKCVLPVSVGPNKEGSANVRVQIKNYLSSDYLYIIDFPQITILKTYTFYSGWSMANPDLANQKFIVNGSVFQSGCQTKIDSNCTISENSNYVLNLPNVTSSDELNSLFSSGVTSLNSNEPVIITTAINSNSTISQIQLFFTHVPIDQQASLLSVYIDNQPVYVLEPLQSNQGPTFKNITFKYENTDSLEKINIAFTTRGDIYLTSMAIYSSNIFFIPPIIPDPTAIPDVSANGNTPSLLTIVLPICSAVVVASSVMFGRLFYKKKFKKFKSADIENEMTTIEPIETSNSNIENKSESIATPQQRNEQREMPKQIHPVLKSLVRPKIVPYALISPLPPLETKTLEALNPHFDEIDPVNESPEIISDEQIVLPVDTPQISPDSPQHSIPSSSPPPPPLPPPPPSTSLKPLKSSIADSYRTFMFGLKGSDLIELSDPNNPLRFSSNILDFNLKGLKATLFKEYSNFLLISNISSSTIFVKIILPRDSRTGIVFADHYHFQLESNSEKAVKLSLKLNCTTKFFEKIVVQFKRIEISESMHSFLYIQVESELSSRFDFNDLEFHNILAKNYLSSVYKGLYKKTTVVIKSTNAGDNTPLKDNIHNEIRILSNLRNKNIVSFLGSGVEADRICFAMEYAQFGSLGSLIHDKGFKFSFIQKIRFMMDTAQGCSFLHASDIIHCDLKLDNLLLFNLEVEQDVCVKVSDFGNSKELSGEKSSISQTVKGTMAYLSNEVLSDSCYSKASDVYAFGILLYEIMTEREPFNDEYEGLSKIEFICKGGRPSAGLDSLNKNIRDLIKNCWNQNPNKRPPFVKIFNTLNEIFQTKQKQKQKQKQKMLQSNQSFNWKEYYNRKNIK